MAAHCMASISLWMRPLFGIFGPFSPTFLVLLLTAVVNIEAEEGPSPTSQMEERQFLLLGQVFKVLSFVIRQTCFQLDKADLVLATSSSQSIFDALVCMTCISLIWIPVSIEKVEQEGSKRKKTYSCYNCLQKQPAPVEVNAENNDSENQTCSHFNEEDPNLIDYRIPVLTGNIYKKFGEANPWTVDELLSAYWGNSGFDEVSGQGINNWVSCQNQTTIYFHFILANLLTQYERVLRLAENRTEFSFPAHGLFLSVTLPWILVFFTILAILLLCARCN